MRPKQKETEVLRLIPPLILALVLSACASSKSPPPAACRGATFDLYQPAAEAAR